MVQNAIDPSSRPVLRNCCAMDKRGCRFRRLCCATTRNPNLFAPRHESSTPRSRTQSHAFTHTTRMTHLARAVWGICVYYMHYAIGLGTRSRSRFKVINTKSLRPSCVRTCVRACVRTPAPDLSRTQQVYGVRNCIAALAAMRQCGSARTHNCTRTN